MVHDKTHLLAIFLLIAMVTPADAQTECAEKYRQLQVAANSIEVKFLPPPHIRVGDKLELSWKRDATFNQDTPVYFILAAPFEVRFEGIYREEKQQAEPKPGSPESHEAKPTGPGFFALMGSARGPQGITFGAGGARAIAPLHTSSNEENERIFVLPYREGPIALEWAVIVRGSCGERKLRSERLPVLQVYSGPPDIVVFDAAPAPNVRAKPRAPNLKRQRSRGLTPVPSAAGGNRGQVSETVLSGSGAYRMHIYPGRYLVFETAAETLIVDRSGDRPMFSPTSRFVSAIIPAPFGDDDEGVKEGTRFEIVDLVARKSVLSMDGFALSWALDDAYIISDFGSYSGFELWSTMITARDADPQGAIAHPIISDREATGEKSGAAWELALAINVNAGAIEYGDKPESVSAIELATGLAYDCASREPCFPGSISDKKARVWHASNKWQIEGGVRFSYTDWRFKDQNKLLVPQRPQRVNVGNGSSRALLSTLALKKSIGWRSAAANAGTVIATRRGLRDELLSFDVHAAANNPGESLVSWKSGTVRGEDTASFIYPVKAIEADLVATVPIAKASLNSFPETADPAKTPRLSLQYDVRGLWRWRLGRDTYWLAQSLRIEGSGAFGYGGLYLFRSDTGAQGSVVDLTELLGADRLSRYGAQGTEPQLKVFLSVSRYLLVATPLGKALAVYDLKESKKLALFADVEDAGNVEELYLTEDAARLVQHNSGGSLNIYSIAAGKRVIAGRYIDGEIILYDDHGYYDATYEGAYFVHLRFPGANGLHTFHQFSTKLKRPDVVRSLLRGEASTISPPEIAIPPTLSISTLETEGGKLNFGVKARSSRGLRAIRFYQDGRLSNEIQVAGEEFGDQVSFPRSGGARWLAAIAVDRDGVYSLPVEYQLPPTTTAMGSLRGVVVGVDKYQDHRISELSFAAADALNIRRAIEGTRGRYYGRIELARATDREATPSRVLELLQDAVTNAKSTDTVLFFYSGHGLRAGDGSFYLGTTITDPDAPQTTAIAWASISELLQRSEARVLVLIDACHSGLAGELAFASNDTAVAQMMSGARAPIIIIAASKGRQLSRELTAIRGGVFTRALENVIGKERKRYDTNANGSIEISELYLGVKQFVTEATGGEQIPWLTRSDLIGDFAIF